MKKVAILIGMVLFAFILLNSAQASPASGPAHKIILQPGNKQYQVNAEQFTLLYPPFNAGGRIFVPLDFLGSVLGTVDNPVNWRVGSDEGEIELLVPTLGGNCLEIKMHNGSRRMTLTQLSNGTDEHAPPAEQGKVITMDVTPLVKEGQTYLPVRWVAEACGFTVNWDGDTQRASLTTPGAGDPDKEFSENKQEETGGRTAGGVKVNSREIKTNTQMELDPRGEHIKNNFYASIHYLPENDLLSFTIPETIPDGYEFYLHVSGRLFMEGGSGGMSFHAFDRESEGSSWRNGKTYTYPLQSGSLDECLLVFGLVDKNGQELLSTAHVFPDGTMHHQNGPCGFSNWRVN